jgi:DNA-directed RNA polymerase subunit alpha
MISNFVLQHPPIKSKLVTHQDNRYSLIVEPLLPGYGNTLGNALRRVLLSSIPGYGVTKIRINDLTHEYQAIEGVVEDALQVILNLKSLRAKILTDDQMVVLTLNKKSAGEVLASDFAKNPKVRIANPDLYICYLDKEAELNIEVEIARGIGYLSSEDIKPSSSTNPQDIIVDTLFSPITNVFLDVEQVRVGDKTNYDKIEIGFETDHTVEGKEVVDYALRTLIDQYTKIQSALQSRSEDTKFQTVQVEQAETITIAEGKNEEINLPTRIKNILAKNGIKTNTELKERYQEVSEFPGITEKSMTIIKEYIDSL